jgi:hypothetical protein
VESLALQILALYSRSFCPPGGSISLHRKLPWRKGFIFSVLSFQTQVFRVVVPKLLTHRYSEELQIKREFQSQITLENTGLNKVKQVFNLQNFSECSMYIHNTKEERILNVFTIKKQ